MLTSLGILGLSGVFLAASVTAKGEVAPASEPIRLHPRNPHYFLWRGRPTVLITSGEHYGAVMNLDFDYVHYLDELKARGMNLTRVFSGVYREHTHSFEIGTNTLNPAPGRYLAPWARSAKPGGSDGAGLFDLHAWDPAYFKRLKDFLAQASARGIVVEFVLFCPMYDEKVWAISPMNARNNSSGIGDGGANDVHTLKNGPLTDVQTAFVRQVVAELNGFDNLYYEICNEPYFGGVTMEWQKRIADTIVAAESALPRKHLIAQNIANGSAKIEAPHPAVSIFNFHYASPPDAVTVNFGLGKAIADDETGFKGSADAPYGPDGWDFLMAGGAVYSNLDYSFSVGHEDGSGTPKAPGGGSPALRRSLGALKAFMDGFDFVRMAPDPTCIKGGLPDKATARALVEKGRQYAIFVRGGTRAEPVLDLPAGDYQADWVHTLTGAVEKSERFHHGGGDKVLSSPAYTEGIALRLLRQMP